VLRHKCFISYHRADQSDLEQFVTRFSGTFIHRGQVLPDDIIESNNDDYVMSRVRELYLEDSTVTIVLIGENPWSRRFVDWEVQASLRIHRGGPPPNGLLAIPLSPFHTRLPHRVAINVHSGYANVYWYPTSAQQLQIWVEEAFEARESRQDLIRNPRMRFRRDLPLDSPY
jgi:hypothetical protein